MRHLKKFEEMDYDQLRDQSHSDFHGSHNDMEARREEEEDCPDCGRRGEGCDCIDYDDELRDHIKPSNNIWEDEEEEDEEEDERAWGDENHKLESFSSFNEKKASPAQLAARKAFADRIKGKKSDKKEDDKKSDKKEDKKEPKKGLTAGQKKLPEAMQKSILAKQKK